MIRPQPTSMGHHRCEISHPQWEGTITSVQENQVSLTSSSPSLIHFFSKATSHLIYERLYIVLQRNPITTLNLVIAHTTKWSWPKRPIGHKAGLDARPDTRQNPNNLHLNSNPVSHTTWRYYVVLVIHFTDKSCHEVTSLPSYEPANHACTNRATPYLNSCTFHCRLPFASPSPPANNYFVTLSRLLDLLSVLRQPPSNPAMDLPT